MRTSDYTKANMCRDQNNKEEDTHLNKSLDS